MKKYITPIIAGLVVFAVYCIGIASAYHKGRIEGEKNAIERVIFVHDTTTVYDTITRLKPVFLTSTVVDSIPYPVVVHDTDTLWAQLPKTVREYGDSTFYAQVSGINPSLDRIDVYQKTQYINNTVYVPTKDTHKDYVELDAKFLYDKMPLAPVTLNVGYIRGPFEVYAGGGYDFLQKAPIAQVGGKLQFKF